MIPTHKAHYVFPSGIIPNFSLGGGNSTKKNTRFIIIKNSREKKTCFYNEKNILHDNRSKKGESNSNLAGFWDRKAGWALAGPLFRAKLSRQNHHPSTPASTTILSAGIIIHSPLKGLGNTIATTTGFQHPLILPTSDRSLPALHCRSAASALGRSDQSISRSRTIICSK
jgi:hypothetical protein